MPPLGNRTVAVMLLGCATVLSLVSGGLVFALAGPTMGIVVASSMFIGMAGYTLGGAIESKRPVEPSREDCTPTKAVLGTRVFDLFAILAPPDVYEEEVGDAIELLERMEQQGRPGWQMWLKVASTIFWVTINGLRHIAAAALGKAKPGRK